MRDLVQLLLVILDVVAAVAVRVGRRLVRGPVVASWSWSTELRVVALRAFLMSSARRFERATARRWETRLHPPIPRPLRGNLSIEVGTLGGRPVEWIRRTDGLRDWATLLYLHGGAYVAGSPATHRGFTSRLTWECHTTTAVLDYRLAPEHRFPAAVDDAEAAYRDLLASGVDPARLFVAGDSAGGGLSVALLYRLKDRGVPLPAGAILFSPYTDLEHTGKSMVENTATDYLPVFPVRPNYEYLGDADPRHPEASVLYGDPTGLPPLLIFAGGREMILDDATRFAARAQAAGVDVTLHIEPDMFHVWPAVAPEHPASVRALAHCAEFIETHRH